MPYSEYLIKTLSRIAKIQSEPATIEARCATANNGRTCYPSMAGALEYVVKNAAREAESALRWTMDHIVPAEREAERLVAIFENLGLDLDEETLATLELMGKDKTYRSEARGIVSAITRQVADVQYSERDYEQQNATEALARAGFVVDDEGETWDRDNLRVTIELKNGRESRYAWELQDNASGDQVTLASGISGEFHRLLVLIGAGGSEDAATGLETPKPMELKNDDYCPSCGTGGPDGCPLCGRTVTQEGDVTITTTRDMLPGEFDSEAPVSTDERFTRVVK